MFNKVLLALIGFAASFHFLTAEDAPVHFAVLGDHNGSAVPGVYEAIVSEVERLKPDFVITVGDQIEGYTEDTSVLNREWLDYKKIVAGLTMPLYLIPGNHDITYDAALPVYLKQAGKPYYSFDYRGLHFVALDASRWETADALPGDQVAWLIRDLKKSKKAKYTFVFLHKPFFLDAALKAVPDTLQRIFQNLGVDAVFAGHTHVYISGEQNGVLYTNVGSSGGEATAGPTGLLYHYTWVTVDKNGITIAPIKLGSVLPWTEFTMEEDLVTIRIDSRGVAFPRPCMIDERLRIKDSLFTVMLNNIHETEAMADTIRWTVPKDWSVFPAGDVVSIPAMGSADYVFKIKNKGELYPLPSFSVRFPYAPGKYHRVNWSLPIARTVDCVRADKPPVIDGKIDESCWSVPVKRFFNWDGGPMATDSVWFYFAYDERNLYLAARCQDRDIAGLVATSTEHDGPIYNEDCVGYFFQPDTTQGVINQIYFNPLGTAFDQKITYAMTGESSSDFSWNGTYEVKSQQNECEWTIEASVPLDQLNAAVSSGDAWRINFRRKQPRLKTAADWLTPITYDPRTYGFLKFK
jgi:predicted phosphodiesterase